jgi:hypothetical protein
LRLLFPGQGCLKNIELYRTEDEFLEGKIRQISFLSGFVREDAKIEDKL